MQESGGATLKQQDYDEPELPELDRQMVDKVFVKHIVKPNLPFQGKREDDTKS